MLIYKYVRQQSSKIPITIQFFLPIVFIFRKHHGKVLLLPRIQSRFMTIIGNNLGWQEC